jgi:hypothetical protein
MKRTIIGIATGACVLLILVASVVLSHQSAEGEADSQSGSWSKLSEGVNVARVARPLAKGPEFAILKTVRL